MNIKAIREQTSRNSAKLAEDVVMEDLTKVEEPEQRKSVPKPEPITVAINLAFDGFDKTEVSLMSEKIAQLWINGRAHPCVKVLPNPPTKLTGSNQN
jgi:hypothetical protein